MPAALNMGERAALNESCDIMHAIRACDHQRQIGEFCACVVAIAARLRARDERIAQLEHHLLEAQEREAIASGEDRESCGCPIEACSACSGAGLIAVADDDDGVDITTTSPCTGCSGEGTWVAHRFCNLATGEGERAIARNKEAAGATAASEPAPAEAGRTNKEA